MDDNRIDEIKLSSSARRSITDLLRRFPVSDSQNELCNRSRRYSFSKGTILHDSLGQKHPCVPPMKKPRTLYSIFPNIISHKPIITETIAQNKAVTFIGDNLQEKSLGIPQLLLEYSSQHKLDCLILVCKYDDVLAVEAAHRLASERNEKVGETVGFKVSNESSISFNTCLIFCTPTVILHTLAARNSNLIQGLTHLILDDLHLRSMYLEVAMIALKDVLIRYEKLKLILNLHPAYVRFFHEFFEPRDVRTDVTLPPLSTKFVTPIRLDNGIISEPTASIKYLEHFIDSSFFHSKMQNALLTEAEKWEFVEKPKPDADIACTNLDQFMFNAFRSTRPVDVEYNLKMMCRLSMSNVNHAHPESSMTPLMIAAARNHKEIVNSLISLGADVRLCTANGWTALDWAVKNNATDAVAALETQLPCESIPVTSDVEIVEQRSSLLSDQKRKLCSYLSAHSESSIDHKGIAMIIVHEISMRHVERVIIFVPGIDDVFDILDFLETSDIKEEIQETFSIIMLHENYDQNQFTDYLNAITNKKGKKLFFTVGTYEHSVMLANVEVVIDSGKDRTVVFDHLNGRSQIEDCWISQGSADQRASLANAPNAICYRMYTRARYESFRYDRVSEITRKPLDNLCLWIRMLAPEGSSIDDYFSLAPEQPRPFSVKVAVTFLKALEALTHETADITELGFMMLNLPVEAKLAKLLLLGVAFRCLDPILTIASALVVQNVIAKSNHKVTRAKILGKKNQFAQQSFSDHSASLKAFLFWIKGREKDGTSYAFDTGFLNYGQCEMAYMVRAKILTHLERLESFKTCCPQEYKEYNQFSDNFSMIRAALCAAFFPNILRVQWEKKSILSFVDSIISIGRHSILHDVISRKMKDTSSCSVPSNWFIYSDSKKLTRKTEVSDLTCVSPLAVALFSGHTLIRCSYETLAVPEHQTNSNSSNSSNWDRSSNQFLFRVVKWICFTTNKQDAELLLGLRQRLHSLVMKQFKIKAEFHLGDTETLSCTASLLREEDKHIGLKLVSGCSQRSRSVQIPAIGNRPFFPSLRNRIRCDFCDLDSNGNTTSDPSNKTQNVSCLKQSCLIKEQELFRRRLDEQKAAEMKSKNAQSRSGLGVANGGAKRGCENQTSLLGHLPIPTCVSDRSIPDQLTRNLIAGHIGRYLPPHMLSNLPVSPYQPSNYLLHCIRSNEYVNPYYDHHQIAKNKMFTPLDFVASSHQSSATAVTAAGKQQPSFSAASNGNMSTTVNLTCSNNTKCKTTVTASTYVPPEMSLMTSALDKDWNKPSSDSNPLCPNSNVNLLVPSTTKRQLNFLGKDAKHYSIPNTAGKPWNNSKAIEDMPWAKLEESWIGFSKTWRSDSKPYCPWIDGDTMDLVKENLINYPFELYEGNSYAGEQDSVNIRSYLASTTERTSTNLVSVVRCNQQQTYHAQKPMGPSALFSSYFTDEIF